MSQEEHEEHSDSEDEKAVYAEHMNQTPGSEIPVSSSEDEEMEKKQKEDEKKALISTVKGHAIKPIDTDQKEPSTSPKPKGKMVRCECGEINPSRNRNCRSCSGILQFTPPSTPTPLLPPTSPQNDKGKGRCKKCKNVRCRCVIL